METSELSVKDIEMAQKFSKDVVKETYNRFNKDMKEREERIFFGKLGEIVFLKFLNSNGVETNTEGMFEVYPGITNVDSFDFVTNDNKKVDIKTAYKTYHKRILIPYDQFEKGKAKDYYVGIKVDLDKKIAKIFGFIDKESLEKNGKQDFGEGDAYWEHLNKLKNINELLDKFKGIYIKQTKIS